MNVQATLGYYWCLYFSQGGRTLFAENPKTPPFSPSGPHAAVRNRRVSRFLVYVGEPRANARKIFGPALPTIPRTGVRG